MRDSVQRATSRPLAKGLASVAVALGLLHGSPALAQRTVAPAIDRRLQPQPSGKGEKGEEPSAWRGSTFSWNNSATTETLGIGDDVQSENPTYEMSFALSPRYYVWEGKNAKDELPASVALGARIETIREFTNSDTTTEQGEWLLSNLLLTSQFSQAVYEKDGYETTVALRAPAIALPTSKAARNNGTIFGLGARLIGVQVVGHERGKVRTITPSGDQDLQVGDKLLVLGTPQQFATLSGHIDPAGPAGE